MDSDALQSVVNILAQSYSTGFNFEPNVLRLLSKKTGFEIDATIQAELKKISFRRKDGVYFLIGLVVDATTRENIASYINETLDEHNFFESGEVYNHFADKINKQCIDNVDDFEFFCKFLFAEDNYVKATKIHNIGIMCKQMNSVKELGLALAHKIEIATNEEHGIIDEYMISARFPCFSMELLSLIVKSYSENLIRTQDNRGSICYRTFESLGLPHDFSEILVDALSEIEEINLEPSEEVLHTVLSLKMGMNFKLEYSLSDMKTYRSLVSRYFKNSPSREWRQRQFLEV